MKRNESCAHKIISIVRAHILLFGSPYIGLELGVRASYEALLDFETVADNAKLERLISVVRAHGILLETGILQTKKFSARETKKLIQYLRGKMTTQLVTLSRINILPKKLGLSFVKKNLGVPLFGYYRPAILPCIRGYIMCYQSANADGAARFFAAPVSGKTKLRYKGLGLEIRTSAPWYQCVAAPSGARVELPRVLQSDNTDIIVSASHSVYMADKMAPLAEKFFTFDPYHYQYAYFFIDDALFERNIRRFLSDILSGLFSIQAKDCARIADRFIAAKTVYILPKDFYKKND